MNTFEITVQRKSGELWPVVVEDTASGVLLPVRSEGILQLDLDELNSQITPRAYGEVLGKAVFQDATHVALVQALAKSDSRLHVLVCVEDLDLRALRWERLCAPLDGRWDFLALNQRTPFSLHLPSVTDRRFPPIGRRDLRALVLVASPHGLEQYQLAPFDTAAAVASVRSALGEIPCDVMATVEGALGPPTLDGLSEQITAEQYTLLHVVCHGRFKPGNGETVLYLAKADARVEPVDGTRLLDRLGKLRGARGLPRFAFLSACESAVPEAGRALDGLAQRLVRGLGMPAVLAMTEQVSVTTAGALTEGFYRRLQQHGYVDLAMVEACAGLAERYDVNAPALFSRLRGRPLFSDALDRPLTAEEIAHGLAQANELLSGRAPVLLPDFAKDAATLKGMLTADPAALSKAARDDRDQALAAINSLCEEAFDLSFNALAIGQQPPDYDRRCPFRGLYPFRIEDREFFFGREDVVQRLKERLAEENFLAVLGPSGSGKSSLVLAGLVPALELQDQDVAYMTPGVDPSRSVKIVLHARDRATLLIVDQFEEAFTVCTDETQRQEFLDRLLKLAEQMRVILTMRADFWGECASFRELRALMQARQELIAPMDVAELRRTIERQAAKVGLRFDADLSNTILDDVQGEPGAMPVLQHALLELWKRRHGRWLCPAEYRAIGGVKKAIAETAETVYGELASEERTRTRDVFVRLTRLGEDAANPEDRRDTCQRVRIDELTRFGTGSAGVDTKTLIKRLADARLIVTSVSAATGHEEIEVAHEALIRYWPRLRRWLDEDRVTARLREGIREAARAWEAAAREEGLLVHRGPRLREAETLHRHPTFSLNVPEQAYVDACVALREKVKVEKQRIARFRIGALCAIALLIMGALALGLWSAQREAAHQRTIAGEQETRRKQAEAFADRQQRISATLALERGITLCENREIAFGMGWFARGLELAPSDAADLQQAIRGNLAGWRHRLNRLKGVFQNPGLLSAVELSPDGRILVTASWDEPARLWDVSSAKPIGEPLPHEDAVQRVAFSPDSKTLLTVSFKVARLWDTSSGKPVSEPIEYQSDVHAATFSPDGQAVLMAIADQVRLLNVTSGMRLGPAFEHQGLGVYAVAMHPSGEILLTGTAEAAWLWDVASGKLLGGIEHEGVVYQVAFTPDGTRFLTASTDLIVRVWDAATAKELGPPLHYEDWFTKFAIGTEAKPIPNVVTFSPDGKTVLLAAIDHFARLADATLGQLIGAPLQHEGAIFAATFSPDGRMVLTGGLDGTARLWDTATGEPIGGPLQQGDVTAVAFSRDGTTFVTSGNTVARLWEVAVTDNRVGEPLRTQATVDAVAFSPDGRTIVTGNGGLIGARRDEQIDDLRNQGAILIRAFSGEGRLWDARTGEPIGDPLIHEDWVASVTFSPDGQTVLTGSWDHTARLWEVPSGKAVGEPLRHQGSVHAVAFSSDGATILTGSSGTAHLWNAATGQPVGEPLQHRGQVNAVAFSPDGKMILTGSSDGTVRRWKAATGQLIGEPLQHQGSVAAVVLSPDGKTILTGSQDKTARLWDASTGKPLGEPLRHPDRVRAVAFSSDAKTFATGGGAARLWNAALGKPVGEPFHESVRAVAFSPDGQTVLTGSLDQTARLWKMPSPSNGELEQTMLVVQVVTGNKVDDSSEARILDATAWSQSRDRLDELGGLPADFARAPEPMLGWHERVIKDSVAVGQWFAVRWHLDRLIDAQPRDTRHRTRRAAVHALLGQWRAALGDYSQAHELEPNNWAVLGARGTVHAELGQLEDAVSDYSKAIAQQPDEYWIWFIRGQVHDQLGQLDLALSDYSKAIELEPDHAKNWDRWRTIRAMLGRWNEALREDSASIDPSADAHWIWRARGQGYARQGLWAKALSDYSRAIELRANDWSIWGARGTTFAMLGQWQNAVSDFSKAIELNADEQGIWFVRGQAYSRLGQWREALSDYSRAIDLRADDASSWTGRGAVHSALEQWDEAIRDLAEAIRLRPHPQILYRYAVVCLRAGKLDLYQTVCSQMLERFDETKDPDAASIVAWTCSLAPNALADSARYVRLAEIACREDPNAYFYLKSHGAALYRAGRFNEAIQRFHDAFKAHGDGGVVFDWFFLAMAHHRLGQTEEATEWLKKALLWIEQATPEHFTERAADAAYQLLEPLRREAESQLKEETQPSP